ncbi:MAG: hypothetical protein ACI9R3_001382 [Verrucomicrobiales bacterium]
MNQILDIPSPTHRAKIATIRITKSGIPVDIEISEITAVKWDCPILTILLFETILMEFKDSDAESAFAELSRVGIPTDSSLGTPPF